MQGDRQRHSAGAERNRVDGYAAQGRRGGELPLDVGSDYPAGYQPYERAEGNERR